MYAFTFEGEPLFLLAQEDGGVHLLREAELRLPATEQSIKDAEEDVKSIEEKIPKSMARMEEMPTPVIALFCIVALVVFVLAYRVYRIL